MSSSPSLLLRAGFQTKVTDLTPLVVLFEQIGRQVPTSVADPEPRPDPDVEPAKARAGTHLAGSEPHSAPERGAAERVEGSAEGGAWRGEQRGLVQDVFREYGDAAECECIFSPVCVCICVLTEAPLPLIPCLQCGIVRFSGSKNGLVMVPAPQSSKLIALVFLKIPLPDAWLRTDTAAAAGEASQTSPGSGQQSRATPTQHLLPIPTPPAGATSGMFSSPNMQPYNLPPPTVSPSLSSVSPSNFVTTAGMQQQQQASYSQPAPFGIITPASIPPPPSSQPFLTPTMPQAQLLQQQQQPQQQQQQPVPMSMPMPPPPTAFPSEGIAGMDFSELQRLLGPEQFAQIMSGV